MSKKASNAKSASNLTIYIDKDHKITIDNKKFIDSKELDGFLNNFISKDKTEEVVLVSDSSVIYQNLVEVLVSLNNAGFNKIKMAYKNG